MSRSRLLPVLPLLLLVAALLAAAEDDSLSLSIARLDTQIELNSNDYEALIRRGYAHLSAGRLDEARRDFDAARASESSATVAQARLGLGDVYRATPNRRWWAIREYRLAISNDSTARREGLYRIAGTAFELGWTDGYNVACDALTELVCLDPGYKDALDIWWTKSLTRSEGDILDVCRRLEDFVATGDIGPEKLIYAARIRHRLGDTDSLNSVLERMETAAPNYKKSERMLLRAESMLELDDTLGFEDCYIRSLEYAEQEDDFTHLFEDAETIFNPTETANRDSLETTDEKGDFFHAFWKRRDPDPTTPHNERLLAHYYRLQKAREEYFDFTPYSLLNTSENYFRLINGLADTALIHEADDPYFDTNYNPMIWWDNCRSLGLQQKGLFYIRHGEPDMLYRFGLPWEAEMETPPYEAWRYGSSYFLFTRNPEPNKPAGSYWVKTFNGSGNIMRAMKTETYRDPLPFVPMASCGADFKGAGGRLEVEFYQSIPVSVDTAQLQPRQATMVIYDTGWNELARRDVTPRKVFTGRDSMWIAVNSVTMEPGPKYYAARMDVPGHRSVVRSAVNPPPYPRDALDMSGFVLGSPPPPDMSVHRRWGIDLLPRPSLAFRQGEQITVYIEVYGLVGERSFDEQVTVTLESAMAGESIIRRIFGSRQPRTSLTLNFERYPGAGSGPFAEHFNVDTSELAPGKYSLVVGITDRQSGETVKRAAAFRLVE